VRQARQRMKLTEKDAAAKLGIKENVLLHVEAGKLQPDETLGKKLERFFSVKLYETA
jgi:ribosome-binding protein aMBF1 (putative translation factor)